MAKRSEKIEELNKAVLENQQIQEDLEFKKSQLEFECRVKTGEIKMLGTKVERLENSLEENSGNTAKDQVEKIELRIKFFLKGRSLWIFGLRAHG